MAIFTFSGVMYRGADPEMASEVRASVLRTGTESADSTLSYEIVAQAPGELPEVIVTVEDLTGLLIDGRPSDPDLVVASLGRITWSGGITDVLVLDLDNDETHLFFIGAPRFFLAFRCLWAVRRHEARTMRLSGLWRSAIAGSAAGLCRLSARAA